ncbi:hypothetical protein [Streptomyces sp. ALB3]|uniref:hypothetical protein n=1 Tax=Streptomyces sp. ALB3 TaxID=3374278 RepID=UPI0037A61D6D
MDELAKSVPTRVVVLPTTDRAGGTRRNLAFGVVRWQVHLASSEEWHMIYALTSFFVLGACFMTWKAFQLWRDPALVDFFLSVFTFLPFGPDARRGEVRSLAITVVSLWAISFLVVAGLWSDDVGDSLDLAGLAAVVVIIGCLVAEACVILFNRPKCLVPPHMRSEQGALAKRRKTRRRSSV